jgi:hypothetical protein
MKLIPAIGFGDSIIKSNGFAVFVMFAMMAAMAYTLWNQYNKTGERLTALEHQVIECYQMNMKKNLETIERNNLILEQVLKELKK